MNRRQLLIRGLQGALLIPAASLLEACAAAAPTASTSATSAGAGSNSGSSGAPAAAATSAPAQAARTNGGTLTIAMTAGNIPYPNTPPDQGAEGSRFVGYQIYNSLVKLNFEQGDTTPVPSPNLATTWGVGPDQLTWTFNLRKGVKFHDGTDFDASAAVFQLDRLTNKSFEYYDAYQASQSSSSFLTVDSYQAVDANTLQMKTKYPDAFLPWALAGVFFPSPTAVKKYGNKDYQNHAVGSGPFIMSKYVDGQVMELTANDAYWGGRPTLDKMVLHPVPDPAARLASFQAGEVDWAEVPPPDSIDQLRSAGNQVLLKQYPHAIIFALNVFTEPFNNPKIRQALQYAIDKDKMSNDLLNHAAAPAYQWMYPGHPWFNTDVGKRYSYDPNKAKQALSDAGASGLKITIAYPTGGSGNMWPQPMMELIQSNFKDVGVDMTMVPLEWNTILTMYRAGFVAPENQKYNGMFFSPNTSAPTAMLGFATNRIQPAGCCNVTGYSSQQTDGLFTKAQSTFDTSQQDDLLRQSMGVVSDDSPALYVVHDLNLRVLSPRVHGFVQPQSWYCSFNNITVG